MNKDSIEPIRSYIDKDGTWWMEFKEEEMKELFKNTIKPIKSYNDEKGVWWIESEKRKVKK